MRRAIALIVALASVGGPWGALSIAPAALAQDTTPNHTATARALFREGLHAVDGGDWEVAADRFRRAWNLRPSPVIAYNLAIAERHLGRLVAASERLRAVLRDPNTSARLEARARRELDEIKPQIAQLRVRVTGEEDARAGTEVRLDEEPLPPATVGIYAPVDPGAHTLTLERGGEAVTETSVTLTPGGQSDVVLEAPPLPAVAPSPAETARAASERTPEAAPPVAAPAQPAKARKPLRKQWWLWTAVGVVVVGAATGTAVALSNRGAGHFDGTLGSVPLGK